MRTLRREIGPLMLMLGARFAGRRLHRERRRLLERPPPRARPRVQKSRSRSKRMQRGEPMWHSMLVLTLCMFGKRWESACCINAASLVSDIVVWHCFLPLQTRGPMPGQSCEMK
ncbi:unnamed protein product [Symbiodinium necroappetens]|uniref:Uncharacterized protein n=1 Tax=Symbiodinium necroappetens TaxID=1628268 RepID=A0A813BZS7_9DINO|nr:unnamed protein product [Symbiodinium necroappetens]